MTFEDSIAGPAEHNGIPAARQIDENAEIPDDSPRVSGCTGLAGIARRAVFAKSAAVNRTSNRAAAQASTRQPRFEQRSIDTVSPATTAVCPPGDGVGVVLDRADLNRVTDDPALWEKVIRKLRTGACRPRGPQPDSATL